jgi:hypothetical protein
MVRNNILPVRYDLIWFVSTVKTSGYKEQNIIFSWIDPTYLGYKFPG